jgi:hypothetical protein
MTRQHIVLALSVALLCAAAWAQDADRRTQSKPADKKAAAPAEAPKGPGPVTAAVLDYDLALPSNADLGSQVADILTVRLSLAESFRLVERADMARIIEEQKLKLVGLVDAGQAARVGKLFGAQLLVMGRGFVMDQQLMIVTKVVGVETGLVKGTLRTAPLSRPMAESVAEVAEDVRKLIERDAAKLLPEDRALADPLQAVRERLGDRKRPTLAVIIPEMHRARRVDPVAAIDPAVETEIKRCLLACGFPLVDPGENDLADWARALRAREDVPWPAALAQADLVVVGEAFSEFALRTGDLVTCVGRSEINVIDRRTGKIIHAEAASERAVDLAEELAGKTALQKAGRRLGVNLCRALAERIAPAQKPKDAGQARGKEKAEETGS